MHFLFLLVFASDSEHKLIFFFFPHQALNEEILGRKKTVDQAIKNGQALLKQTTGKIFSSFMLQGIRSFSIKIKK